MLKLTQSLDGVAIEHGFDFSLNDEEKKAGNSKAIKGTFLFDGMDIAAGLDKAVRQATIAWQHANRDDFSNFEDGQKVVIMVTAAGRKQVDNTAATATEYAGADLEARRAILVKVTSGELTDDQLDVLLKTGTPVDVTDR